MPQAQDQGRLAMTILAKTFQQISIYGLSWCGRNGLGLGGSWYLLYSRELFHADEPLDMPPIYIRTPSIRAGQVRTKLDESNALTIMEEALAERGIRAHWPTTKITIRGDGHYGRREVMDWCEDNGLDYVFGLPGNKILAAAVEDKADDIRTRRALEQMLVHWRQTNRRWRAALLNFRFRPKAVTRHHRFDCLCPE
jgi:hypothetical protein